MIAIPSSIEMSTACAEVLRRQSAARPMGTSGCSSRVRRTRVLSLDVDTPADLTHPAPGTNSPDGCQRSWTTYTEQRRPAALGDGGPTSNPGLRGRMPPFDDVEFERRGHAARGADRVCSPHTMCTDGSKARGTSTRITGAPRPAPREQHEAARRLAGDGAGYVTSSSAPTASVSNDPSESDVSSRQAIRGCARTS